ncbi:hypothetical protein CHARACLAT_009159, partial [Characodon lateralis]|nr:hypothetical protein [Characodon lateralis]
TDQATISQLYRFEQSISSSSLSGHLGTGLVSVQPPSSQGFFPVMICACGWTNVQGQTRSQKIEE